jgi:ABC-2 type transport system permease protein
VSGDRRPTPSAYATGVLLVAGRELGMLFDSGVAYVYAIAFALLANSIFMNEFFLTGQVDMTPFFDLMPLLLAFFLPAISMRLWAEERKQRTIELLLTLPIAPSQATLGKYLAGLGLFGLFLLTTLPIPLLLSALGEPDLGLIVSGYVGLVLFGGLFLALGLLLSALSSDQITAFATTTFCAFALVLLGNESVVAVLDGLFPELPIGTLLHDHVSVAPRYGAFVRGVIGLSSLIWFGGLAAVFLWATGSALERART